MLDVHFILYANATNKYSNILSQTTYVIVLNYNITK